MEPYRAGVRKPLVCLSGEREDQHQGLSKYWLWINLAPRLTWRNQDEIAVSPWPTPVSPPQGKTVKGWGGRAGEESWAVRKVRTLTRLSKLSEARDQEKQRPRLYLDQGMGCHSL